MWQKDANDLGMEKFLSKYSDVVLKPKSQVPEPMSMPYDEIERLLNADKNQKKEKGKFFSIALACQFNSLSNVLTGSSNKHIKM